MYLALAAEQGRGYAAGAGAAGADSHRERLDRLEQVVDSLRRVVIDDLEDGQLRVEVAAIERATRRLEARASRIAAALARREATRARQAGGDARAGQRAARREQQRLANELRWTPSKAKRAVKLGDGFDAPDADEAFDDGRLPASHAALLAETLRWIEDPDVRATARKRLLAAADDQDAVTFGRTCRGVLAELDHDGAAEAARRRRARQAARLWQTEDGMQALSGQWSGLDGETIATAIHAFRRQDAKGENRRPEQVTAQAIVDLAKAALRAGEAPSQHGIRPHVIVTIDWKTILEEAGRVDATWSGPLTFDEIRAMLADAGVSRLLVDPKRVPTEAGEESRNVPAGLYRSLLVRDGGCIADGCDVPAAWCQVMHLATPYRLKGRLTLRTAGLGCTFHHTMFDKHGWTITWLEGRPVLHPRDAPPRARRDDGEHSASNGDAPTPTPQSQTKPSEHAERGRRVAGGDDPYDKIRSGRQSPRRESRSQAARSPSSSRPASRSSRDRKPDDLFDAATAAAVDAGRDLWEKVRARREAAARSDSAGGDHGGAAGHAGSATQGGLFESASAVGDGHPQGEQRLSNDPTRGPPEEP